MSAPNRMIAGMAVVGIAALLGAHSLKKTRPTDGDELLMSAERLTGIRAPSSLRSGETDGYVLLGPGALCHVAGLVMDGSSARSST